MHYQSPELTESPQTHWKMLGPVRQLSTWFPSFNLIPRWKKSPYLTGKTVPNKYPRDIFQVYIGLMIGFPPSQRAPSIFPSMIIALGGFWMSYFLRWRERNLLRCLGGKMQRTNLRKMLQPNLGGHLCSGEIVCTSIFDSEPVEPNLLKYNNWPPTSYK